MNGTRKQTIAPLEAMPDFPDGLGHHDSAVVRVKSWWLIAAPCILIPGILWCVEPWQRPGILRVVPDAALFALTSLGLLGMAVRVGFVRKSAVRWRWALACCVCGFALLAGMRLLCGKLTLAHLESRIDQEISSPGHVLEEPRKPISARLVGTLEWMRLGVPNWLSEHAERRSAARSRRLPESLIASSRWPLRRAMADSMVGNHTRAKFLVQNWKDYFPAIIGADVSLEHRRDWMSHLNALRENDSLTATPRQTAILFMALVILTDPPEFENWRIPVRDAMLGWRKPLAAAIIDV